MWQRQRQELTGGFRADGTPTSAALFGKLLRDSEAMLLARAYQEATGFQDRQPGF